MDIGPKIKSLRKEKGMTLQQLADIMGCSPQLISQYETGKRTPKLETIRRIAKALSVPSETLLEIRFEQLDATEESLELYEAYQNELNKDNDLRHHLLIYHYDLMNRTGRDSLMEIIASFKILNDTGRKEAVKRVEELTEIPRYTADEDMLD